MKKLPKGEKKDFLFFIIYFTFFLSPYGKKQNHLLFPPFVSPGIGKPQGKMSHEKFFFFCFFFFFTFLHPTAPRNRKNYHLPFFRNSDLKCPKMPLSALKFHILQITFFPAVILRTHIPSQTDSVFPNQNAEKTRLTPFSKNYFFLLSSSSPYPRNTS